MCHVDTLLVTERCHLFHSDTFFATFVAQRYEIYYEMKILSEEAKQKLRNSNKIKAKLCYEFDRSMRAIEQWADKDNPALTSTTAVDIIAEEGEMERDNVLTNTVTN